MPRVCVFGHPVLTDDDKCYAGHSLGASFECPVSSCIFVTKPTCLNTKVLGEEQMQLHLEATHGIVPTESERERIEQGFLSFEEQLKVGGSGGSVETEKDEIENKGEKKTCQYCYKEFSTVSNVKRHVKQEHLRKNRYECIKCSKSFAAKISLEYHLRKHVEGSELSCEYCSEKFNDFTNYAKHRKIHRSQHYQFEQKCPECGKIILGKDKLKRHQQEVHAKAALSHACSQCDARYRRKHQLDCHVEIKHNKHEGFSCENCLKTFTYRSNMKRHAQKCKVGCDDSDQILNPVVATAPSPEQTNNPMVDSVLKF